MDKIYFHNIANKYKKEILLDLTFSQILENYKQPDWCGKHESLNGLFGCDKLLGDGVTSKESCINCKDLKNEINK